MNRREATRLLRSLEFPCGDYAVFGSAPLLMRGITESVADLDLISRGPAWEEAMEKSTPTHLAEHGITVCSFFAGLVTVGNSWAYGHPDIDRLIDTADTIDGLPFVRLEHVAEYKRTAGRSKDLEHLDKLQTWLGQGGGGDH